jgi:Fe-Mn family superoxide dismutase
MSTTYLKEIPAGMPRGIGHAHRFTRRKSMLSRRNLLVALGGATLATCVPRVSFSQGTTPGMATISGAFSLEPLPFPTNALEPTIDARTMELHHDKHHAGYVSNLNTIAKDHPQIAATPVHELIRKLSDLPDTIRTSVRNNLGGHVNHMMFWSIMKAGGGSPSGELASAINRDLGGMEKLRNDFDTAGTRVFGSGWVFVTVTPDGRLAIEARPNQDNPLMDGKAVLFGNDVWEHAYYLQYQNRRADYLKAWWNVVNWTEVGHRYETAKSGGSVF